MEEKSINSSSTLIEIDNKLGIETENHGLDTTINEQNSVSTTSHFSEAQQDEVRKILQNELSTATRSLKNKIKKEGDDLKKDFIIIFGLFASFASFLSIQVQVFKTNDSVYELIGITALTVAFVLFFAITISDIAKGKNNWSDIIKPLYILTFIFIIIGIYFIKAGKSEEQIKYKVSEKLSRDSIIIESLNNKLRILDVKIIQMDSSILLNNSNKKR
jgi:hypothetical protein